MVDHIDTSEYQKRGIAIREVAFEFPFQGINFSVLAMPNPEFLASDDKVNLLKQCTEAGYNAGMSLEESPVFDELAGTSSFTHYKHMRIGDYAPPPSGFIEYYFEEQILQNMKTKSEDGLLLHCGAGHGRSGTVLAALKIMEMVQKKYMDDPMNFHTQIEQDITSGDKE